MPGRDPQAAERSQRVATEIKSEMRRQGLSGVDLIAKIEEVTGKKIPNTMWLSRRLNGAVNLVQPERVIYGPSDDLTEIAQALGVKPDRLVRVVNITPKSTRTESTTGQADQGQAASTESAEQ